jgi:type II secretory pathway pseudopilin PulG
MLTLLRRRFATAARDEGGFAMVPVIIALAISSLLVVAAVSTATGDLPVARKSQDRKFALSAAEAGLNYYQFHLNLDPDYWTKCDQVPDPNPSDASDNSPVSLAGANPRKWRSIPGTSSAYAIELIGAPGRTCTVGDQTSMLDGGTFKIRVTGRSNGQYRTLLASFRRAGFLDFVYLPNYETLDPDADTSSSSTIAACSKPRSLRPSACATISFRTGDLLKGPMHTNDESIAVCGAPSFGRTSQSPKDRVDVNAASGTGWFNNGSCGAGPPVFNTSSGKLGINGGTIGFPSQNDALATVAANGGLVFNGKTTISLSGNSATVTNAKLTPTTKTFSLAPSVFNGVIYVKDDPGSACTTTDRPTVAQYNMQTQCAEATVYGSYTTSMTIASQRDIIVRPQSASNNGLVRPAGDPSTLGLIANGFVRVYHSVTQTASSPRTCTNTSYVGDVEIDAAILSLQHSFINDNHDCGGHLGTLTVKGGIAQNFRGTVGLVDGTGYTKDYNYDDRLKYRNPPFFLPPLNAAWSVGRENEQVPARKGT